MNYLIDIIIIVIVFSFISVFARKGLIGSIFKSFRWLVSILLTYMLYPIVSAVLRKSVVFEFLKSAIMDIMNLENIGNVTGANQVGVVNNLDISESLKTLILENNNSVIYDLLGVDKLQEYIAGFVANIVLNIIVGIVVFLITMIIIKLLTGTFTMVFNLPLIKQVNYFGGGLLGFAWGIVFVWFIMLILNLFITTPFFAETIVAIENSYIGKFLYENNLILEAIFKKLFGWG